MIDFKMTFNQHGHSWTLMSETKYCDLHHALKPETEIHVLYSSFTFEFS